MDATVFGFSEASSPTATTGFSGSAGAAAPEDIDEGRGGGAVSRNLAVRSPASPPAHDPPPQAGSSAGLATIGDRRCSAWQSQATPLCEGHRSRDGTARPRSPTWPTELPATIGASRLLRAARGVHTPPWRVQPRSGTPTPCYSHGNTPSYSQYGVPHGPGTLFDKARPPGPDRREHPLYAVLCSRHVGEIPPRQNTPTSTNSPLHAAERRGLRSTPQGRGIQAASLGNDR